MKKITFILIMLFLICNTSNAQICNIGNEDTTGFIVFGANLNAHNLLGVKYNLSNNGVLNSLNLIGKIPGAQVQMAVYSDSSGVPWQLIISTNIDTVDTGIVSMPVPATQLNPGDYWIMAIYNSSNDHTYRKDVTGNPVYYHPMAFGSAIPTNASGFITYTGRDFTYFMDITCGILGLADTNEPPGINIFPNPANEWITIESGNRSDINNPYVIYDQTGRQIIKGIIDSKSTGISIGGLATGVYIIRVGDQEKKSFKLLKL